MAYYALRISAVNAHLDSHTINPIIKEALLGRAERIAKNPDLRKDVGETYVNTVYPFIPYKTGQLANSGGATRDGRVYWSAKNPNTGVQYAPDQYYNTSYKHPSRYPGHMPQAKWTEAVAPGTPAWDNFVAAVEPTVRRYFADAE